MPRHSYFKPRALVVALAAAFSSVQAAPNGGQVVSGSAIISQPAANLLQVNTSSSKTIINWQQFSIASGESVQINLPSANSAILNRVTGGDLSQILGSLQSNGRVFLINPNGVVFGQGAQIDTAGFIASTLNINDADFLADRLRFAGDGGAIANSGQMVVKGDLALIASSLTNSGTIRQENGNLLLAAGQTVELVDLSTPALHYQLSAPEHSVLNLGTLEVANGAAGIFAGTIRHTGHLQATRAELGDGGRIILRADNITVEQSATLTVDAQKQGDGGSIELVAAQTAAVHGSLSARGGSESGDGGFIETSGKQVQLAGINVDTRAASGKTGNWLIDPNDFVVAASGGDITGVELSGQLAQNNITLSSVAGANAGNGDLLVNDSVAWSANTTLTLQALRNVAINQQVAASGNSAGVVITPGAGGQLLIGQDGKLDLTGSSASLSIGGNAYQLIRNQSELGGQLEVSGGLAATERYAIAADFSLDAAFAMRQGLASGAVLEGLGHTLTGQQVALFAENDGDIQNLSLAEVAIADLDKYSLGALANYAGINSRIQNVTVSGSVTGSDRVGGGVGINDGWIADSRVNGRITGHDQVGGLVGSLGYYGSIDRSQASGSVTGNSSVGGLVGTNDGDIRSGSVVDTQLTGDGEVQERVGGIAGWNRGSISNSFYNVDTVTFNGGRAFTLGALYGDQFARWEQSGRNLDINSQFTQDGNGRYQVSSLQDWRNLLAYGDSLSNSFVLTTDLDLSGDAGYSIGYFSGDLDGAGHTISNLNISTPLGESTGLIRILGDGGSVSNLRLENAQVVGVDRTGIVVGENAGELTNVRVQGHVTGGDEVGGLVGSSRWWGIVSNSYANVNVQGDDYVGGLVGAGGSISNSAASGEVSGRDYVGGVVGSGYIINDSQASGLVTGRRYVGGLSGDLAYNGSIGNSQAHGDVTGYDYVGGLVGYQSNNISNSQASGAVTGHDYVGGLVGNQYNGTIIGGQASGSVVGNDYVGGLVGSSALDIGQSQASGRVTGNYYVGGIAGRSDWQIRDSVASGSVAGIDYVGGLAGKSYGYISQSQSSGSVTGHDYVGGIAGGSYWHITASRASGKVVGNDYVGGLVGESDANIGQSQADSSVVANNFVGGLVGRQVSAWNRTSSISTSVANASVRGNENVGGLVGSLEGGTTTLVNSYAQGLVIGNNTVGGAVGYNEGSVEQVYANALVQSGSNVGGLIGSNVGSVSNAYWNTDTSGLMTSAGGSGLTTVQMKSAANFSGWDFSPGGSWRVLEGSGMPYLDWQYASVPVVLEGTIAGGSGQRVGFAADGVEKGAAYNGVNNRYYMLLPDSNGSVWMAYSGQAAAIYQNKADINFGQLDLAANQVALYGTSFSNATLALAVGDLAAPLTQQGGALTLADDSSLLQSGGTFLLSGDIYGGAGQRWLGGVVVNGDATLSSQSGRVDFAGNVQVGAGSRLSLAAPGGGGNFTLAAGSLLQTAGDRSVDGVENRGQLTVASGELSLNGGGSQYGSFTTAGRLFFKSGSWSLQDGVRLSGSGSFASDAAASVALSGSGAGVTLAAGATLNLSALHLGGTGKLVNQGVLTGTNQIADFSLDNQGTATLSGTQLRGTVRNSDNLTLNQAVIGTLDNSGSLLVSASSRTTNARQQDGVLTIAAGQSLTTDTGTFSWGGGKIVSGAGGLAFVNGGQFVFSGNGNRVIDGLNLAFDNLTLPDGSLTLKSGSLMLTGASTLRVGTSLALQGGQFINDSTLSVGGNFTLSSGSYEGTGALTMLAGGVLQRPSGSTVSWQNSGAMVNQGTLDIAGGTVTSALTNDGTMNIGNGTVFNQAFTNTGTLSLSGSSNFQGGLTQSGGVMQLGSSGNSASITTSTLTLNGGVLRGSGTINGNVSSNGGTFAVGYSPGSLVINGNLTLNASSVLNMELGGVGAGAYDSIVVNGQANLAGTMNVVSWGGFSPSSAFNLPLIQYQSYSGNFLAINMPTGNYQSTPGAASLNVAWSSSPVVLLVSPPSPVSPLSPAMPAATETMQAQADVLLDDYQPLVRVARRAQDWLLVGSVAEPELGEESKELEICQ